MRFVVDTNVAVVANGGTSAASAPCRLACIDFLEKMVFEGSLIVDAAGLVEEEYRRNLSFGQPGVGNRFIQAFLTVAAGRVERVALGKSRKGAYIDFPESGTLRRFDQSDRKFAALARKAKAPVANATDTDWLEHRTELSKIGVDVHFLCGCISADWFI